jgi:hypothetical protein
MTTGRINQVTFVSWSVELSTMGQQHEQELALKSTSIGIISNSHTQRRVLDFITNLVTRLQVLFDQHSFNYSLAQIILTTLIYFFSFLVLFLYPLNMYKDTLSRQTV